MKRLATVLVIGLCLLGASSAWAESPEFFLSSPPVISPLDKDALAETSLHAGFTIIDGYGLRMTGAGLGVMYRRPMNETFAWDVDMGASMLQGSSETGRIDNSIYFFPFGGIVVDVKVQTMMLAGNVEYTPLRARRASLMFFAGPNVNMSVMDVSVPAFGVSEQSTVMIYGAQGGAQMGIILAEKVSLVPYLVGMAERGRAYTDYGDAALPLVKATAVGADMRIGGLLLGSSVQQSFSAAGHTLYTATVYKAGYRFEF